MSGRIETAPEEPPDLGGAADRLLAALRHRYGLKRDDLLERKALGVLRQRPTDDVDDWLDDLLARPVSDPAWLGLVDAVTIHETYFFRDPGQLRVLREELLPALIKRRIGGRRPAAEPVVGWLRIRRGGLFPGHSGLARTGGGRRISA